MAVVKKRRVKLVKEFDPSLDPAGRRVAQQIGDRPRQALVERPWRWRKGHGEADGAPEIGQQIALRPMPAGIGAGLELIRRQAGEKRRETRH